MQKGCIKATENAQNIAEARLKHSKSSGKAE